MSAFFLTSSSVKGFSFKRGGRIFFFFLFFFFFFLYRKNFFFFFLFFLTSSSVKAFPLTVAVALSRLPMLVLFAEVRVNLSEVFAFLVTTIVTESFFS